MNHPTPEQFLSACGSDEPIRVGLGPRDRPPAEGLTFGQPFLVIGRAPGSDLRLDHWQVSRRHAYLQLIDGRFYCVDLGSRTGTHGGDASERSGWLDRGQAIQIGPFSVHPSRPDGVESEDQPIPGVTWELPGRAIGQSIWRMDRPLVLLGRSPACRIRVVQPDISKFHCSLVLTPVGVWVVDLLGQNGIFVNDEPVRFARMVEGDELRVGRHLFRPRYDEELPALGSPPPTPAATGGELALISPEVSAPPTLGAAGMPGISWSSSGLDLKLPEGSDPTVALLVQQFGQMQQQMFDQFHHTMMMMFEGFAALQREQVGSLREELDRVRDLSREIESLRAEAAKHAEAAQRAEANRLSEAARHADRARSALNGRGEDAPPKAKAEPARRATPAPPNREVDIHAQLCFKLTSMQAERQNRWQKILSMMSSRQ